MIILSFSIKLWYSSQRLDFFSQIVSFIFPQEVRHSFAHDWYCLYWISREHDPEILNHWNSQPFKIDILNKNSWNYVRASSFAESLTFYVKKSSQHWHVAKCCNSDIRALEDLTCSWISSYRKYFIRIFIFQRIHFPKIFKVDLSFFVQRLLVSNGLFLSHFTHLNKTVKQKFYKSFLILQTEIKEISLNMRCHMWTDPHLKLLKTKKSQRNAKCWLRDLKLFCI